MFTYLEMASLLEPPRVRDAWQKVRRNGGAPGTDRITIEELEPVFDRVWPSVGASLRSGSYRPLPLRVVPIPKASGGVRELAIPAVIDRVVQQVLAQGFAGFWEPRFSANSYAYRPGRGPADAIDSVLQGAARYSKPWAASLDIADFFDSVPFGQIRAVLAGTPCQAELEEIAMYCVSAPRRSESGDRIPVAGLPQGSPLSPVLANAVLHPLDSEMERHGCFYARYADNLMIISPDEAHAMEARRRAAEGLASLGLALNESKSMTAPLADTDFLGFGFRHLRNVHVAEISPAALEACWRHLHLLRSGGAEPDGLRQFMCQWLGYYGRAATGHAFGEFIGRIAHEFGFDPAAARTAGTAGKRNVGYEGSPPPPGFPLPDAFATGAELLLPFAKMLMRRVRFGADFSRSGLIPRLKRIRVGIGRHHFTFRP